MRVGREHQGAFDGVLQLADVAGPVVGLQGLARGFAEGGFGTAVHGGQAREQMFGERQDVGGAFAQGGHLDGEHAEAEVEVFAEGAGGDGAGEVGVGERDQARVDGERFGAAEALEAALFEHAQKFRLRGRGEGGDFVENDGAGAGHFQAAELAFDGSGEGAALVAEQFGFDQFLRQAGAIDFQVGRVASRAELVDEAREMVFAGAALAGDEHGGGGVGDFAGQFEDALRRRVVWPPRECARRSRAAASCLQGAGLRAR